MSIKKDNTYWKDKLSAEQYRVLREKGTERPFTGELLHNKENGMYTCAACGENIFSSTTKFDSGSGWPSFFDVVDSEKVKLVEDTSLGMKRTEVVCTNCGGHLGHLFDDGPVVMNGKECTGKRYCINSVALEFNKK